VLKILEIRTGRRLNQTKQLTHLYYVSFNFIHLSPHTSCFVRSPQSLCQAQLQVVHWLLSCHHPVAVDAAAACVDIHIEQLLLMPVFTAVAAGPTGIATAVLGLLDSCQLRLPDACTPLFLLGSLS
jgi:hypothetical protein